MRRGGAVALSPVARGDRAGAAIRSPLATGWPHASLPSHRGEPQWRTEHGAVAAEHDRKFGIAADFLQRADGKAVIADVLCGQAVDDDFDPALAEKITELQQWRRNLGAFVFADQSDRLE